LATIAIVGIIFAIINNKDINFEHPNQTKNLDGKISILGIFASLPPIFFAFDGFTAAGALTSKLNEPKKEVPKAFL
jgi:amino acid transporter